MGAPRAGRADDLRDASSTAPSTPCARRSARARSPAARQRRTAEQHTTGRVCVASTSRQRPPSDVVGRGVSLRRAVIVLGTLVSIWQLAAPVKLCSSLELIERCGESASRGLERERPPSDFGAPPADHSIDKTGRATVSRIERRATSKSSRNPKQVSKRRQRRAAAASKNGADKGPVRRREMSRDIDHEQLVELLAQFYAHASRLRDEFQLIKRKIELSIGPEGEPEPRASGERANKKRQDREAFFRRVKMHLGADDESLMKWLRDKQERLNGSLRDMPFELLSERPNRTINVCADGPKILLLPNATDYLYCYTSEQWYERLWSDLRLASHHYPIIVLNVLIFLFGTTGNIFVCLSVKRNHQLRSVTNYFIVNLAFADFLVILICLPATVVWDLSLTWFFDTIPCKLIMFLQDVSISVSVLTLTAISIDRYYAICHPLKFKSSLNQAKRTIALIWLVSLVTMAPDLIYLSAKRSQDLEEAGLDTVLYSDCNYDWSEQASRSFQFVKTVLLYLLPFLLMFCAHYRILKVLRLASSLAQHHEQQQQRQLMAISAADEAKLTQADRVRRRGSGWLRHTQPHRRRCSSACEPSSTQAPHPRRHQPDGCELVTPLSVRAAEQSPRRTDGQRSVGPLAGSLPATRGDLGAAVDEQQRARPAAATSLGSSADSDTGTVLELRPAIYINDVEEASLSAGSSPHRAVTGAPTRTRIRWSADRPQAEADAHQQSNSRPDLKPAVSEPQIALQRNSKCGGPASGRRVARILEKLTIFRAPHRAADTNLERSADRQQQIDKQKRRLHRLMLIGGSSRDSASGLALWRSPTDGQHTAGVAADEINNSNAPRQNNSCTTGQTSRGRGAESVTSRPDEANSEPPRGGVAELESSVMSDDWQRARPFLSGAGNKLADTVDHQQAKSNENNNNNEAETTSDRRHQPPSAVDTSSFNYKLQTSASDNEILGARSPARQTILVVGGAPVVNGAGRGHVIGANHGAGELVEGASESLILTMHNKSKLESRQKAAKMLTAIVILFGICYLPVHLINFLRQFIEDIPQTDITSTISMLAHCVCYLNSAINPIIYNHMNSVFRAEFRKFLSCLDWRRASESDKQPTNAAIGNDGNNSQHYHINSNCDTKNQFNYPTTNKINCHNHHLNSTANANCGRPGGNQNKRPPAIRCANVTADRLVEDSAEKVTSNA